MKTKLTITICLAVLALGFSNLVLAQNIPVVHWINDAGQDAATVLNTNGVFVTDFKTHNDLTVTRLTADSVSLYSDVFGGATPGNNPAYLTNFVGVTSNGTGDGVAGDIKDLCMTSNATGTLQFDFLFPLTPQDRILLIDVDGPESYLLQAYAINGSSSNQVSFVGWNAQDFSGTTGMTPNSQWPVWDPANGTLTSGTSANLDEELFVLTPAQNINRLVISKQSGANWSTGITFFISLDTADDPAIRHQCGVDVDQLGLRFAGRACCHRRLHQHSRCGQSLHQRHHRLATILPANRQLIFRLDANQCL